MFLTSSLTGRSEILFPEMLALLLGIVCTDKLPWKTDALHTVIMMTLCAAAGFAITRYVPFVLYAKVMIGFCFSGLLIVLSDCSLMPCISACLLPIYLGDASPVYPAAVFVMTTAAVVIRAILIKTGMKSKAPKFCYTPDFAYDLKNWAKMLVIFAVISAVPRWSGYALCIAPPLVVTFVESFCRNMYGRRFRIWFVVTIAAVIGALSRFVGVELFGLEPCIPAVIAAMLAVLEMKLMNVIFPPAGAVVLLAFLIDGNVFMYPPMIAIGTFAVLLIGSLFGAGGRKRRV